MKHHGTLISWQDFQALENPFVMDCSSDLLDPNAGRVAFNTGHLSGAVFMDLGSDLSSAKIGTPPRNGRHPLPTRAAVAEQFRNAGLNAGQQVVVYDRSAGMFAVRCWWLLKWLGHEAVALLDGGIPTGTALETEVKHYPRGNFSALGSGTSFVHKADVAQNLHTRTRLVMDARAPERFCGEVEPMDPVPGHIPGAVNRFFKLNLQDDGRFKPAEQLRAEFTSLMSKRSAQDIIMQCGSGVTACHNILAMEHAGLGRALLYPGSYSEWCADPALPISKVQ
jgi:thiosulfate/3-mercaptopyruvate sulfurtransferase